MKKIASGVLLLVLGLIGCEQKGSTGDSAANDASDKPVTQVRVDGSSTVAPISTAAAELFREKRKDVNVTVGTSGTGGGFKKFLDTQPDLRTDINDASRPIKPAEVAKAKELGVEFIELPIALDGLSIVVNPKNTFCDHLTVEELKKIWEPGSKISNWKEVRDGFQDLALKLYGAGTDSGTFDYFTEAINGKEKASRNDYTMSEDDNTLVQGVTGDPGALGYFGFSYYENNRDKLKLLAIAAKDGQPIKPNIDTIRDGTYKPLSRPLFLYVNAKSLERPEVQAYLEFYLSNAKSIVENPHVGYVALSPELYAAAEGRLKNKITGSAYAEGSHGQTLTDLYVKK